MKYFAAFIVVSFLVLFIRSIWAYQEYQYRNRSESEDVNNNTTGFP